MASKSNPDRALFEYLLRRGDDLLILGHRLSEWCGHAPILEEDIALANMGLDCIGQGAALLELAATLEGSGRNADALAYFREAREFRNALLVEQPNGDFAQTIVRQFLYAVFARHLFEGLEHSTHEDLRGIASKAKKEFAYHVRHCGNWVLRMGDGTEESHSRAQQALDLLWPYTGELFESDEIEQTLERAGIVRPAHACKEKWSQEVAGVIQQATLAQPVSSAHPLSGGRSGLHSEHLGHLLSEMQILARSYPGATW